ncbi:uncharacterized protein PV07_12705 [Cladophialophora immunda]|uniref:Uncharacterized protein n=1 Tax=Cladophialophora immunda TaxID=569365 RepID=A0A0D1Z2K7_9EURO|nr:uncharacterized protein PV07_12705 [Cladophialophora immunda]KIW21881.1 hypothetical protein PV07_12705 [Cladophialophora immunda]
MASAQFRKPPQAPPSFTATPESLVKDTEDMLARSKKIADDIVAQVAPEDATFQNVLLPMAHDENQQALKLAS